jgi:hypothetical protein
MPASLYLFHPISAFAFVMAAQALPVFISLRFRGGAMNIV